MILQTPDFFRPTPNYPTYPPYHTGLYLEDYFIDYWTKNQVNTDRQFIAVSWTSYYNNGLNRSILQSYLNSLDITKKYFVVCQHDDAPLERLPPNTIVFCAGGNYSGDNKISIPLICSEIPKQLVTHTTNKDIFCSFVGSMTHPIRNSIIENYKDNSNFVLNYSGWNARVSDDSLKNFIDITTRSKYTLCPRGYGTSSFRLYETMQLNSVPVYVSEVHDLPWSDELDWNEFCVIVKQHEISNIHEILSSIDDTKYHSMLMKLKSVYDEYFTLNGVCGNIIRKIK
jgi:hypothetical protein